MSDKQRVFEAELQIAKTPKLAPKTKPDEATGKGITTHREQGHRKFSRDTVMRLINWFKQE
jgi:hypothetical protein